MRRGRKSQGLVVVAVVGAVALQASTMADATPPREKETTTGERTPNADPQDEAWSSTEVQITVDEGRPGVVDMEKELYDLPFGAPEILDDIIPPSAAEGAEEFVESDEDRPLSEDDWRPEGWTAEDEADVNR